MLEIERSHQFKKDFKHALKRGKDADKFKRTIEELVRGNALPARYRDHQLTGNYNDYRECHIEPDWLLIYCIYDRTLRLERTGSHADLFE
jgi:mRNA interferase YafQ